MNIAIIPARKNSKRIPNKNIKIFYGKEMIYFSIKAAIDSKLFKHVIVSTDCERIAKISKKYGADIFFKRPQKISDDKTGVIDVIKHSIKWLKMNNYNPETICCIFPTAPLIKKDKIIEDYKIFKKKKPDFLISAVNHQLNFFRSFFSSNKKKGLYKIFSTRFDINFYKKKIYYDAGQFYFANIKTWLNSKSTFTKKSMIVEIEEDNVRDLNTKKDLKFLKILYKNKKL